MNVTRHPASKRPGGWARIWREPRQWLHGGIEALAEVGGAIAWAWQTRDDQLLALLAETKREAPGRGSEAVGEAPTPPGARRPPFVRPRHVPAGLRGLRG